MTNWKTYLTETERVQLAEWEADEKRFKDQAAIYAVWKRRLADKVRAREKRKASV
jgi:hypothetical protein